MFYVWEITAHVCLREMNKNIIYMLFICSYMYMLSHAFFNDW